MFRIGDFSKLAQVTVRALRLYDELGLLKPAHIDRFTDYRYYTIEQRPRLNRILALKDLGFSLEEIARRLSGNVPADQLWEMLTAKQTEIEREVQEAKARLARVEARLRQIQHEGAPPEYDVVLKKVEPQMIASSRRIVPEIREMPDYRYRQYKEVYDWLAQIGVRPLEPELAIYHNPEYVEEDIDMELAAPVDVAAVRGLAPPPLTWPCPNCRVPRRWPAPSTRAISGTWGCPSPRCIRGLARTASCPAARIVNCTSSGANWRRTKKTYATSCWKCRSLSPLLTLTLREGVSSP